MIIFFVLGGAALDLTTLSSVAPVLMAYIGLRLAGRVAGSFIAHNLLKVSVPKGQWLGLGLLPQAGIALGIAVTAAEELPETATVLVPVTLAATVCFEVAGPFVTRIVLLRCAAPGTSDATP